MTDHSTRRNTCPAESGEDRAPEVRVPDPVLFAHGRGYDHDHRVLVSMGTSVRGGEIAHLPLRHIHDNHRTACGITLIGGPGYHVVQARHACWYALACPECFDYEPSPLGVLDQRLDWQLEALHVWKQRAIDQPLRDGGDTP